MRAVTTSIALALVLGSTPVWAQSHGFVSINGGYRPAATTFSDTVSITQNVEPGAIDTAYRVTRRGAPPFARKCASAARYQRLFGESSQWS